MKSCNYQEASQQTVSRSQEGERLTGVTDEVVQIGAQLITEVLARNCPTVFCTNMVIGLS